MIEKLGGRKLVVSMALTLVGILLDRFGVNGLSENLKDLLMALGIGFMGGNALEHTASAIRAKNVSKLVETLDKRAQEPSPETTTQETKIVVNAQEPSAPSMAMAPPPQEAAVAQTNVNDRMEKMFQMLAERMEQIRAEHSQVSPEIQQKLQALTNNAALNSKASSELLNKVDGIIRATGMDPNRF